MLKSIDFGLLNHSKGATCWRTWILVQSLRRSTMLDNRTIDVGFCWKAYEVHYHCVAQKAASQFSERESKQWSLPWDDLGFPVCLVSLTQRFSKRVHFLLLFSTVENKKDDRCCRQGVQRVPKQWVSRGGEYMKCKGEEYYSFEFICCCASQIYGGWGIIIL